MAEAQRDTYGASQLNLSERLFWCEDFGLGEIVEFLDDRGEHTDDPDEAVVAIVKISPAIWLDIRVGDYTAAPRH